MKVLLLTDVKNVGRRGEVVDVAEGHAQNFLISKNLARKSDTGIAKHVLHVKEKKDTAKADNDALIISILKKMDGEQFEVSSPKKNIDKQSLYKPVSVEEFKTSVSLKIERLIPDAVLKDFKGKRTLGIHTIDLSFKNTKVSCSMNIVAGE